MLITPEICANFKDVPACSYVGSSDSQNYQLCAQCYPNKINSPSEPTSGVGSGSILGIVIAPFLRLLGF